MSAVDQPMEHSKAMEQHGKLAPAVRETIAVKLQQYYQLECTRPTPARLQQLLDELLARGAQFR